MSETLHQIHELANVGIVGGYLTAAFYFVAILVAPLSMRAAGSVFFVTCAGTHLFVVYLIHALLEVDAIGDWIWGVMLGWHVVEVVAIWVFLLESRRFSRHAGIG